MICDWQATICTGKSFFFSAQKIRFVGELPNWDSLVYRRMEMEILRISRRVVIFPIIIPFLLAAVYALLLSTLDRILLIELMMDKNIDGLARCYCPSFADNLLDTTQNCQLIADC